MFLHTLAVLASVINMDGTIHPVSDTGFNVAYPPTCLHTDKGMLQCDEMMFRQYFDYCESEIDGTAVCVSQLFDCNQYLDACVKANPQPDCPHTDPATPLATPTTWLQSNRYLLIFHSTLLGSCVLFCGLFNRKKRSISVVTTGVGLAILMATVWLFVF